MRLPYAVRTSHHVQIVHVIAVRRAYRVIALRNENHLAILNRQSFVYATVVVIDPLYGETGRWFNPIIIYFLKF
jgi:hypothetical protein